MNAIQNAGSYVGRRAVIVTVVFLAVLMLVYAGVRVGLWAYGAFTGNQWPAGSLAEQYMSQAPAVAPEAAQGAAVANDGPAVVQAGSRAAWDTSNGYGSADEAGANCKDGETVIANWRGGYSCNIGQW